MATNVATISITRNVVSPTSIPTPVSAISNSTDSTNNNNNNNNGMISPGTPVVTSALLTPPAATYHVLAKPINTKIDLSSSPLSPRVPGDAADGAGDYSARKPVEADHRYISNLIYATWSLIIHIMDVITSLILVALYFDSSLNSAAISLLVIHGIRALTQIEFEWLNHGRLRYFLLDLFYLRIVAEYWRYVIEWKQHFGRPWRRKAFRSTVSFETFIGSMPSLIVQTYVFIIRGYMAPIQLVAFFTSIGVAFIELLHHFHYVTVNRVTYASQMTKAVFNSIVRTALVAVLVNKLGALIWLFVLLSYLFGLCIYYRAVRKASEEHEDDDPLQHGRCHAAYGHQVSITMLFVSFPFGVTHSVFDWWNGYLASEMKMLIENIAMVIYVLQQEWQNNEYGRTPFYAAVFLVCMVMLLHFVGLALLQRKVKQYFQRVRRNLYTTSLIVHLFAHLCRHLKYTIDGKYPDEDHYREGGGRAPEGLIKVFPTGVPSTGGTREDITSLLARAPDSDEPKHNDAVIAITPHKLASALDDDERLTEKRSPSHPSRRISNTNTDGNTPVPLIGAVTDTISGAHRLSGSGHGSTATTTPAATATDSTPTNNNDGETSVARRRASSTLVSNMRAASSPAITLTTIASPPAPTPSEPSPLVTTSLLPSRREGEPHELPAAASGSMREIGKLRHTSSSSSSSSGAASPHPLLPPAAKSMHESMETTSSVPTTAAVIHHQRHHSEAKPHTHKSNSRPTTSHSTTAAIMIAAPLSSSVGITVHEEVIHVVDDDPLPPIPHSSDHLVASP